MTSSSASDHVNPAGISALMQKKTTSKGMEANKNFGKWLSCGIQMSGSFGLHHVCPQFSSIVICYPVPFDVPVLIQEFLPNILKGFIAPELKQIKSA
jgi:hypothetical protein